MRRVGLVLCFAIGLSFSGNVSRAGDLPSWLLGGFENFVQSVSGLASPGGGADVIADAPSRAVSFASNVDVNSGRRNRSFRSSLSNIASCDPGEIGLKCNAARMLVDAVIHNRLMVSFDF